MSQSEAQVMMAARPARGLRRKFYVGLSVLMALLVLAGFWPSYYGPLLRGEAETRWILHFHGAIYAGWMALLIVQSALAARGNLRMHRSLGTFGIGYGGFVLLLGLLVSFVAPAMHVTAGEWSIDEAAAFLPIPLIDMVLFGGLFIAAVIYRGKPETHKRLMLLATVALLFAAAFRLNAAGVPFQIALALWYLPVILAIGYDYRTRRHVHPVYWIGLAAMTISLVRLPLGDMESWLAVGRPIFALITR
jgi:hypothetical protein